RHVESVVAIHAVKAVECRLVQINEPGGHLRVAGRVHIGVTKTIEEARLIRILFEQIDDSADMIADAPVGTDQSFVDIGEPRSSRPQRKEKRSPSEERLKIARVGARPLRQQPGQQLAFSTCPFQKWTAAFLPRGQRSPCTSCNALVTSPFHRLGGAYHSGLTGRAAPALTQAARLRAITRATWAPMVATLRSHVADRTAPGRRRRAAGESSARQASTAARKASGESAKRHHSG